MKKSRFSEEQMVTANQEHEAVTATADLCRRLGVGPLTLYRWKQKYGGTSVSDAVRLKSLEGRESAGEAHRRRPGARHCS